MLYRAVNTCSWHAVLIATANTLLHCWTEYGLDCHENAVISGSHCLHNDWMLFFTAGRHTWSGSWFCLCLPCSQNQLDTERTKPDCIDTHVILVLYVGRGRGKGGGCCFFGCLTSQQHASVFQDLLRQLYMLPHWDRSCGPNYLSRTVTVYWHRTDQSQRWHYNTRCMTG